MRSFMASVLAASLVLFASCQQQAAPVPVPQAACTTALALTDTVTPPQATTAAPEFKDVLEILDSNATGRLYKCTICHPTFKSYDVVSDPMKFTQILDSMNYAATPANPMPRGGDSVSDADLATLKAWAAADYPEKATSKKPAVTTAPKTAPTDDGSVTGKPAKTPSSTGC